MDILTGLSVVWKSVSEFNSSDHWPSASPDLNPFDYKLWPVLETMVCTRFQHNLESLKQLLVEDMYNFPMDVVHTAIGAWPNIFWCCIKANSGHFVYIFFLFYYISNKLCNTFSNQTSTVNFVSIFMTGLGIADHHFDYII